jgi:hypothetical protein
VPDLYAALHFTLVSLPGETVVADFTVAEQAPAASGSLTDITAGLESLLQKVTQQAFDRVGADMPDAQ